MKAMEWKTYRTRFLVKAKQLTSSLSFVDPLGRQHCGRKGDYLVESSDGVISIAPRQIFEDIYVPISPADDPQHQQNQIREKKAGEISLIQENLNHEKSNDTNISQSALEDFEIEPLEIEEIRVSKSHLDRQIETTRIVPRNLDAPVRRPLPQPCRDRRATAHRLALM